MSDFGSGLEQCGPRHEMSGRISRADLRRRIAELEAERAEYKSAVNAHLASHHHGGYNSHTALTALAETMRE